MLRLTLRSGRDGRFLARIIDRGGFAFVLDYGDRRIIRDAAQRLMKGFTMWRSGRLVTVTAQDNDLLQHLAELYANEGLLVFLEEPTWHGRRVVEVRSRWSGEVVDEEAHDDLPASDDATEVASIEDLRRVVASLDDADPTEEVALTPDRAIRATWTPAPVGRVVAGPSSSATRPPAPERGRLPLEHHLPYVSPPQVHEPLPEEDDPTDLAPVPLHDRDEDDETEIVEPTTEIHEPDRG